MPDNHEKPTLAETVAALQARWGRDAISRLGDHSPPGQDMRVSTGFAALDEALGNGGLPRGRISEIIGVPTSGMATLALKVVAQMQAQGGTAVYLDGEPAFDPDYAARCGVALEQLLLVQPADVLQMLALAQDLVGEGGADILVCDLPLSPPADPQLAQSIADAWGRLLAPLARSGAMLLCLLSLPPGQTPSLEHYPPFFPLPHYASVRLLLQRERWLYHAHDISGYEAQVLLVKNKLGTAGQKVHLEISLDNLAQEGPS